MATNTLQFISEKIMNPLMALASILATVQIAHNFFQIYVTEDTELRSALGKSKIMLIVLALIFGTKAATLYFIKFFS